MVSVGKSPTGRPVCKMLQPNAFFASYNEAYTALVDYHRNPYDLDRGMTVKEIYERWSTEYFKTISDARHITSAWKYCSSIYNMKVADMKTRHIKGCIDSGKYIENGVEHMATAGVKTRMKSLFNLLMDYAVEYELIDRNIAREIKLAKDIIKEKATVQNEHVSFTEEEIQVLWDNIDNDPFVEIILIQCYSGWRPQELGLLEMTNIDVNKWSFQGGVKTKAGKDRVVPIHSRIQDIIYKRYHEATAIGSKYLINVTGSGHRTDTKLTYERYRRGFERVRDTLRSGVHRLTELT
jgi:integrase